MAIKYAVNTYPQAKQGNLLASNYGEHMVSLNIKNETANGYICKVGQMKTLDLFEVETAGDFEGYIALKGADGMYCVVVTKTDPLNAIVINKPLINEESPRRLTVEANYYNDPADGAVRGYQMHVLDRIWLSADAFDTTTQAVGVGYKIDKIGTDGKPHLIATKIS